MAANIAGYLLDNAQFEIWDYRNTGKVFSNVHLRSNGNLYMNTAGNLVGRSTYVTGNLIMSDASKTLSVAGDSSFNGNVTTNGTLSATGNLNSSGNLNVSGDSAFSGNVTTSRTLTATGNLNSSGNLNVSGTSYLSGNVFASNNLTVSGTLSATGNLNSSGNLNVSGDSAFSGNVTTSGTLSATGNLNSSGNLNVSGTSNLSGNVFVSGTISATGNLNSSGNLNVSGTANVSGNLSISGTSDFTGMVTMSNVLNVNGNLNANSNLIVNGTAYLGNIVTTGGLSTSGATNFTNTTQSTNSSTGAVTVAGGLGVAKNVNVGGNLAVTDATTLSSTLNVSGVTSLTSAAQSSSTSNGALVVAGGVGIAKDVNIGGNVNVGLLATFGNGITVNNGATLNGGVVTNGGMDINGGALDIGTPTNTALYVSGGIYASERGYIANTLQTTTEGTGAFIVKGGASVALDLYVGGNLRVEGNTTFVNTEQVTVEDPLISLNQNNNLTFIQTQGGGLNFYATDSIEADNIQGYLKTTGNGQDLSFKSVNTSINGVVTVKPHESLNSDVLVSNVRANADQRIYNSNLVIDNKLALGGASLTTGNTLSVSGSASITNRLTLGELVLAKNDLATSIVPAPIPAINGDVIGTVNGACGTIYANTLNIINTGEIVNFRVNNNFMDVSRLVFVNVLSYDGGEFVPIVYCKSSNAGSFDLEVSCPYTFVNGNLFIKYMLV